MVTITINISEEFFDYLSLMAAHQDKSPNQLLTEKIDLYFEYQRLLNKMVNK